MSHNRPVRVLLIEDNPGDVLLTTEALEDASTPNTLTVHTDGEAAMTYLREKAPRQPEGPPDLILLDLNLPKVDGHEILSFVKRSPELRLIPVVVLTSSAAEADTKRAYIERANAYVVKPVEAEDFDRVAKLIGALMESMSFPTIQEDYSN